MVENAALRERRNDLDWVRILAVLLLFPFHTARIFDTFETFYVKNDTLSPWLSYVVIFFLNKWHMPLLFLLAGASSWYALRFRSGGRYLGERLKRLLVPFVFGTIVVFPPQMYFALLHRGVAPGGYLRYYPSFFRIRPPGMPDYTGVGFSWGHLWFILNLFFISLAALPVFLSLKTKAGQRAAAGLAAFLGKGPAVLLLALPFPFVRAFLPPVDGKPVFLYLMVFVLGFLLMSDERYRRALVGNRCLALILAVACAAADYAVSLLNLRFEDFSPPDIGLGLASGFGVWFWLVAILGFGGKHLNAENKALRYAREGAYPFYVIHQSVIVVIGYYAVRMNAGVLPKFFIVVAGSFAGTLVLYDLIVRRTNVTRFLFGMKRIGAFHTERRRRDR